MDDFAAAPTSHNFTLGLDGRARLAPMNEGITPYFFLEPVLNPKKTAEAGRPIYEDMEKVRLFVAADLSTQCVHPVDDGLRERFSDSYRLWREKKEMHIEGTPVRQWALLTPANIAEFEALKIFSVEALAQVPDSSLQRVHGLREWREKAKAYLAVNKDSAAAVKFAEENVRLKDEMANLNRKIEDLAGQVASLKRK